MPDTRPGAHFRELAGRLDGDTHHLLVRVYYEDTDFSGFVYHASYLRFLERGRTELLRALEVNQSNLHEQMNGLVFVVRRMVIDFIRPAKMDDVLTVLTCSKDIRGASMMLSQEVRRGEDIIVKGSRPRWKSYTHSGRSACGDG
jgi:acyl-CoA thioester hydrolase